ncbi:MULTISPECIES: putative leader peptide [Streptomyces]
MPRLVRLTPVPYELLLHGRVHVDLARHASALCPGA